VEDTIELSDIHHGRTVLKATLDGDLEALQEDLVRVRDLLDDEHDRVAKDLGVEKNKKLHLENHQVYHYSLRITKAVSPTSVLLSSSSCAFSSRCHTLTSFLSTFVFLSRSQPHHIQSWDFEPSRNQADQQEAGATRNKKGYIDLTTQKSGSIFTTRTLRELSDQYLDLQKKYETLQNSLVKKVVEIAGMSYFPSISRLLQQIKRKKWMGADEKRHTAHYSRSWMG
jgi:DNA mismatch repair protein MSH2